jgi:hypothetical protein
MTPPNDERNLLFSNAEEEIFLPECDLVLTITEDGESSRAFSTINQVPFVQIILSVRGFHATNEYLLEQESFLPNFFST